jgi:hypothetical protein
MAEEDDRRSAADPENADDPKRAHRQFLEEEFQSDRGTRGWQSGCTALALTIVAVGVLIALWTGIYAVLLIAWVLGGLARVFGPRWLRRP